MGIPLSVAQVKTPTHVTITRCSQKFCDREEVFTKRKCDAEKYTAGTLIQKIRTGFVCFCPCPGDAENVVSSEEGGC